MNAPSAQASPRPDPRALAADERGAIMVMGIFMCLLLVGALWYIAGIGDAVVYRERMQEASDAVAFSTAVIEARGMNMLVLLNLVMAAILAIRVALNMVMYATLAAAIVLAAIGAALSWLAGAGAPFLAAAEACTYFYEEVLKPLHDDVVSPAVDDALEALHDVESTIPKATVAAAIGGAQEIASKYEPTTAGFTAPLGNTLGTGKNAGNFGLPIENGTTHKLCMKSFDAVKGAISEVIGSASEIIVGPIEGIVNALGESDAFCELGGSDPPPDTSAATKALGAGQCDANDTIKQAKQQAADSQAALEKQESDCGYVDGEPPDPPPQNADPQCSLKVSNAQAKASADQANADKADKSCSDGTSDGSKQSQKQQQQVGGGGSGNGKEPAQVLNGWHNGTDDAQILAIVEGDGKAVTYSPRFVKIAGQGKVNMDDPSLLTGQRLSWSQAEFFYDCKDTWQSKGCDADEEAMWNFHWRARLRLVNPGAFNGVANAAIEAGEIAMAKQIAVDALHTPLKITSLAPARLQFLADLPALVPPMSMALH